MSSDPVQNTIFLRGETPSGSGPQVVDSSLTEDLLRDLISRLKVVGIFSTGIWTFYLLFYAFAMPHLYPEVADLFPLHFPCWAGIVASVGMVAATRLWRGSLHGLLKLGLGFGAVVGLLIAYMNVTTLQAQHWEYPGVSWVALWILIYATTVPRSPRTMLIWGFMVASFEPVMGAIALSRDPDADRSFLQILPYWKEGYMMAVVGVVPARLIYKLSTKVRKARELGSYRLGKRIGQGGMGEVWTAKHRLLSRPAAVKLIRPDMMKNPERADMVLRRFEREASATAALGSPHSIELYDFGISRDGAFYYVMELLDGFDLDSLITKYGPVSAGRTAHILYQTAHSLEDAHARGLVHRDVKPANLFVCRKGQDVDFVKVLDFGLVLEDTNHDADVTRLTRQGITTGTPAFMSPEQASGDPSLDHRADLYSLGCVAYWLLTGTLVFPSDSPVKMAAAHLLTAPEAPSARTEVMVPPSLESLILRLLEKAPGDRPASAAEIRRELEAGGLLESWSPETARGWWDHHAPAQNEPTGVE